MILYYNDTMKIIHKYLCIYLFFNFQLWRSLRIYLYI